MREPLPVDALLPDIRARLEAATGLVLEAPPGAGKTTRVPPALLDATWARGEIVVLEPRRIATRMAAKRVAEETGERLGERVGYTVRFDDRTSAATRLRFVTEGVLTRRMLSDPELRGVSVVVLDELHERHVHADVALALLRRLQRTARPDIRVIAMSATLDATPVADFLGCEVLRSEGRRFDVRVEHAEREDDRPLESRVASAVRRALADEPEGDVLVFLPGAAEIRRAIEACGALAAKHDALLLPLYGDLPAEEQDRAVRRADRRKIIVSTNVAESSLTIDGVVAVVDSGLVRRAGHAPWSGLPTLRVEKASRASCVQRAGRAGRTREGRAYRLYTKADLDTRPEHEIPELLRVDLAPTLLELRAAGITSLDWLTPPSPAAWDAAEALLRRLAALDDEGRVTGTGRAMLRFPLHPRLARVLVEACARGVTDDGCAIAALLGERDVRLAGRDRERARGLATEPSDVLAMLDAFREAEAAGFSAGALRAAGLDPGAVRAAARAEKQLARIAAPLAGPPADHAKSEDALLASILAGYTDRVARRVSGRSLALAGGGSAELAETSVVRDAPLMVAVDAEQRAGKPLVRVASAVDAMQLIDAAPERIRDEDERVFVPASGRVEAVSRMVYEGLVIDESRGPAPRDEATARVLAEVALAKGPHTFAPAGELSTLVARAAFAHGVDPAVPEVDEARVRAALRSACEGKLSLEEVREVSLVDLLRAELGATAARIDRMAPARVTLPSGRVVKVRYEPGKPPYVASRLQDFFGTTDTPRIGEGRTPLVVHLLAPNQRAVQVTTDLAGFWSRHYAGIRKELMRKYPRHAWPEDPIHASPPAPRR